jgi:hypothetical protein
LHRRVGEPPDDGFNYLMSIDSESLFDELQAALRRDFAGAAGAVLHDLYVDGSGPDGTIGITGVTAANIDDVQARLAEIVWSVSEPQVPMTERQAARKKLFDDFARGRSLPYSHEELGLSTEALPAQEGEILNLVVTYDDDRPA